jgi:two-component system sensor histidine kinase AlgZ
VNNSLERRTADNLPDLGDAQTGLALLALAQIVAIILVVGRHPTLGPDTWNDLAFLTVVAQSIAIGGILALKMLAAPLRRLSTAAAVALAAAAMVAAAYLVIEALVWLLHALGSIPQRWPEWRTPLIARALPLTAVVLVPVLWLLSRRNRARHEIAQLRQDRLEALHLRIRPHFLFNSMNSVSSLIRSDPEVAEKALQDLADVFRALLANQRKLVPVTAEGELVRQYLEIEKLRLGDRLHVRWTMSKVPRGALIPMLTLQPLVENAVYHGIEPSFTGGTIEVQMWAKDEMLNIRIANPVPETLNPAQRRAQGNRIAMENVRARLQSHFGEKALLENFEQSGTYVVTLSMPVVHAG